MRTGIELVEILDDFLKSKNLSRRQFCGLIDISHATIAVWKTKNILPSIEILDKVAKFMNVSLDWLVNGDLVEDASKENIESNLYSRRSILNRIIIILKQNNNDYNYDYNNELEYLHQKYLADIVEYDALINWVDYKANMSESVLPAIAERLNVTLQWLLTQDEYHQEDFDAYIFGLAKKYSGLLKGYNCLEEEDMKFVDKFITTRLEFYQFQRSKKHQ